MKKCISIKENRKKCDNTYLQDRLHPCAPLGRLKNKASDVKAHLMYLQNVWFHCCGYRQLTQPSLSFPHLNCGVTLRRYGCGYLMFHLG